MKKLVILLVEDSDGDALLIRESLEEQSFVSEFYRVENGKKAIQFLNKEAPYQKTTYPSLILMDINMPTMDGHEALTKIKSIVELKHIPVIMLTTSSRKDDILRAYREHCSSYIIKPDDIFELEDVAATIKKYWANAAILP